MSFESTMFREDNQSTFVHLAPSKSTRSLFGRTLAKWSAAAAGVVFGSMFGFSEAHAQGPSDPASNIQYTLPYQDASGSANSEFGRYGMPQNAYDTGDQEPDVVGGFGFKTRAGHEAGHTVGRSQSITYFDLAPYIFFDDLMLFGEGRLAVGNNGDPGGSLGAGARYYMPRLNSVAGVSGWWDMDRTRGPLFQQWGLSGEFLSEYLDIRGNWYTPVGETFKIVSERFEPGSQQFIDRPPADVGPGEAQGSYLAFQRRVFTATAMRGFDTLFSVPIPGQLAQNLNMEAGAGFYNYSTADDSVDEAWGWRARIDMDIMERTSHLFLEVMHDRVFKTNVVFGIDINYWNNLGHRPRVGHSQHHRLAEWVRRNRTVVAFEGSFLRDPENAINPRTGLPYVIYQVWENPDNVGPNLGTSNDPFSTLNAALTTPGADIIFVQSGSVITSAVNIDTPNLQVIGEQIVPTIEIAVQNLNENVVLPTRFTGTFEQPVVRGVSGQYAVQLGADNTRFAGIDIEDFTGTGSPNSGAIIAEGRSFGGVGFVNALDTVNVRNVQNANGVYFADLAGTVPINDLTLTSIAGLDAFHVERGTANIFFTGSSNHIDNTAAGLGAHGYAIQLIDTAGSVNMAPVLVEDNGGAGVRVVGGITQPSISTISFGDIVLNDSTAASGEGVVHIENFNGRVTFGGDLTIDQAGGADGNSFVVRNLQPNGAITNTGVVQLSGATNILNRRGTGILIENLAMAGTNPARVLFNGPVSVNALATGFTGTDPAVHFNSPTGTLQFLNTLDINGGLGNGIEIANIADDGTSNDGFFLADNTITISNIRGTSFNVDKIEKEEFTIITNGITINNRGTASSFVNGHGLIVNDYAGSARFNGVTTINNQFNSFANAIEITSNDPITFDKTAGAISFGTINIANQRGTGSFGVLVRDNAKEGGIGLGNVSVQTIGAEGIRLEDNTAVTITGGTIETTNARAITVQTVNGTPPGRIDRQQHSIVLSSVSATGADYGIRVLNSDGLFAVTGQPNNPGSGGTISGMTVAGASFNGTQVASLQNMSFNGNLRGVVGQNMLVDAAGLNAEVFLSGISVNGSASEAIFMEDVRTFSLLNSSITSNGMTNDTEQIDFLASTAQIDINGDSVIDNVGYFVRIENNNITDSLTTLTPGTDMIAIRTNAGIAQPVSLNLQVLNNGSPGDRTSINSITANRSNAAALGVNWQGNVTSVMQGNRFETLNGANQLAVAMNVVGSANVDFFNNSVSTSGAGAIGFGGIFTQSSTVSIRDNQQFDANGNLLTNSGFLHSGIGSRGIDLTFRAANNIVNISNNLIQFTDTASSGTGVRFSQIFGNNGDTIVTINGNNIQLFPNNFGTAILTTERGFHFVDVRGIITLDGTVNNIVNPSNNPPFYIDFSTLSPSQTNGTTIIVNDVAVPF